MNNIKQEKKYLIIADSISLPIDEGLKKVTYNFFIYCLSNLKNVKILSSPSNLNLNEIVVFPESKTLLNRKLYSEIKNFKPDEIIYIPAASTSFFSFIRFCILRFFSFRSKISMISIQKRKHKFYERMFIKLGSFNLITFSKTANELYSKLGVKTRFFPLGVDTKIFKPCDLDTKLRLRSKFGFDASDKIVLHVGHINARRNIQILTCLLSKGYKVIVIGSSSTQQDSLLCNNLKEAGIIIFDTYIENIQEYYQMSDYYVFPVMIEDAAIEFPLSILEAMSCNLPILTTRFGGLVDFFAESNYFKYFVSDVQLVEKASQIDNTELCNNRSIIELEFIWDKTFEKILS